MTSTPRPPLPHPSVWTVAAAQFHTLRERATGHIPTPVMLDFGYGGLDEEILRSLYGVHLDGCEDCRAGVELYASRERLVTRLHELVPAFALAEVSEESYPIREKAKLRLMKFLAEGNGELQIVAGEANPLVYDDEVREVLARRSERAVRAGAAKPRVICGPVMGLDGAIRTREATIFPRLAEAGRLDLLLAVHRQPLHFRMSDGDHVYTEGYHAAGDGGPRQGVWYRSRPIANMFRRRMQALIDGGLAVPAQRDDFLYLPMDTVRRLEAHFRSQGQNYDHARHEELCAGLAAIGEAS